MQGVDFIVKYYIIYLSNYQLAISPQVAISKFVILSAALD